VARQAFARNGGFVDGAAAGKDGSVGGDAIARADHDGVAQREGPDGDFAGDALGLDEGGAGHQLGQAADAGAGAAGGDAFKQFPDEEEQYDRRGFLGGADDHCADGGDGHQCFDGKGRAGESTGNGAAADRHEADQ
jgi:hypothetical protein